jgi:hypothetical protein
VPPESFIPPLNRFLEVFGLHLPAELNGFLVGAILLGVGFYVLVWRTRFGFDLRATGANAAAARAAGVNPKAMILKTMAISGGIAGLVAVGPMLGDPQFHRYNEQLGARSSASRHRSPSVAIIRPASRRGAALRHHRSGHASALAEGDPPRDLEDHAGNDHSECRHRVRSRQADPRRGRSA